MGKGPNRYLVVGSDTDCGKTAVACGLVRGLRSAHQSVGVYKPVVSGAVPWTAEALNTGPWAGSGDVTLSRGFPPRATASPLLSQDAWQLWEAAGWPETLEAVCPQVFEAPLAPPLAAAAAGTSVDQALLLAGLRRWESYEALVVESAGGWYSPLSSDWLVSDLALALRFPLVVVVANRIGAINQALLVLRAIERDWRNAPIAALVLNQTVAHGDASVTSNFRELQQRTPHMVLEFGYNQSELFLPTKPGETKLQ